MSKKTIAIIVAVVAVIALVIAAAFALGRSQGEVAEPGAISAPAGNDDQQSEDAGGEKTGQTDAETSETVESPQVDAGGDLGTKILRFSNVSLLEGYGFTQADVTEADADLTAVLEADGDDPQMTFYVKDGSTTDADGNTVAYVQSVALADRYYSITLDANGTEGERVTVARVTDNSMLPEFVETGRSE